MLSELIKLKRLFGLKLIFDPRLVNSKRYNLERHVKDSKLKSRRDFTYYKIHDIFLSSQIDFEMKLYFI